MGAASDVPSAGRAPLLAVAGIVAAAFAVYGLLAASVGSPHVFTDELLYFDAAAALAEGDGLTVRGEHYSYSRVYPALLAPLQLLAGDRESTYALAKALNALLFALAAVPVFLLARRLLDAWPAVAVAGLAVAIPSTAYVSVVMTEALAFLVCSWAFYTVALAVERPTVARQLAALATIALATGVRTQFALLFAVYLLALVVVTVLVPGRLRPLTQRATALWPTWVAVGLGAVVAGGALTATSGAGPLGGYADLRRSYDASDVGRWLAYHLANLELYLAVVPLVVTPIVLAAMIRRSRLGDDRHAAFLALFVSANAVFLVVAAAFNSTEFAIDRLHDRVLFYVVPLWLVVLFVWIRDGAPRPLLAALIGTVLALVLPLLLPFSQYARDDARQQFNGIGTTLWAALDEATSGNGRLVLVFVVAALVAATLLARERARLLPLAVLAVFLVSSVLSWSVARRVAEEWADVLPAGERSWLDDRVPDRRRVTALVAVEECADLAPRDGFYLTEFFNSSLARAATVGTPQDSLPTERVAVRRDGSVMLESGKPLVADLILAQPGVALEGRSVAEGTAGRLTLWDTAGGPVRLVGVASTAELVAAACGRG